MLYGRNLIKGINTWSAPFVEYSVPFLDERRTSKMDENKKSHDDAQGLTSET